MKHLDLFSEESPMISPFEAAAEEIVLVDDLEEGECVNIILNIDTVTNCQDGMLNKIVISKGEEN